MKKDKSDKDALIQSIKEDQAKLQALKADLAALKGGA
jgi:hypothetical protein